MSSSVNQSSSPGGNPDQSPEIMLTGMHALYQDALGKHNSLYANVKIFLHRAIAAGHGPLVKQLMGDGIPLPELKKMFDREEALYRAYTSGSATRGPSETKHITPVEIIHIED